MSKDRPRPLYFCALTFNIKIGLMILYGRILVCTKSCEILVKRPTVQDLAHLLCARNGANLTFILSIKSNAKYRTCTI